MKNGKQSGNFSNSLIRQKTNAMQIFDNKKIGGNDESVCRMQRV